MTSVTIKTRPIFNGGGNLRIHKSVCFVQYIKHLSSGTWIGDDWFFGQCFHCILTVPKHILVWQNFHSMLVSETWLFAGRLQNTVKLSCQRIWIEPLIGSWLKFNNPDLNTYRSISNRKLRHCWSDKYIEAGHNYHSYQKTYICQGYVLFFLGGHNIFISEQTYKGRRSCSHKSFRFIK